MSDDSFAVHTAMLRGIEALPVTVEVSASQGLPGVTIVGMVDIAVREAAERVRCAIKSCGFEWPRAHLTVNLAPSEVRKSGTGFDLPIAVAILACTKQIPQKGLDSCMFIGELTLRGEVSMVRGTVAFGMLADREGLTFVSPDAMGSKGKGTRMLRSLRQMRGGVGELSRCIDPNSAPAPFDTMEANVDFADVIDQEMAKRAFVIAAAGDHGLLMIGPPGSGKSMLAKRMPSILSPLTESEKAESLLIHSAAGQEMDSVRRGQRPFRAPHHGISRGGLIGGGRPVRPGEVSLAHHGVLFLDEMPEFGPSVLQNLRQPMEDREVRIVRVDGTYLFPCDFMLVGAANPCPCGHLGDPGHTCSCPPARVQAYQARIGGPLMDRMDVVVDVARPSSARIIAGERGQTSREMAKQVQTARAFSSWRRSRSCDGLPDRQRGIPELSLDSSARSMLEGTAQRLGLGGRNIVRIARVARTIADMAECPEVGRDHVVEACAFRTRTTL